MHVVKSALGRVLSILGLIALGVIGVALLGVGLVVGIAVLGLLTLFYLVSKILPGKKLSVRGFRIASCPECGRITTGKVCDCGARLRWL